jgi:serine/threonine protein phosphatase 1
MNHIKTLDMRQHSGRIFFTTDLHGHYDLLHEKLKEVGFDSNKDILIIGGDMCDRGPDSAHVLDYLNEPWVHCIRGNHEELLIGAVEENFEGWATNCLIGNGGVWVGGISEELMKAIYESFKSLPLAIELLTPTEKIGIIHAQVPYNNWDEFKKMTGAELEFNGAATAQWARTNYDKQADIQVKGVDRLMVGHTPTDSGEVEVLGNTWYCDLGSFFRDKISFVQLM